MKTKFFIFLTVLTLLFSVGCSADPVPSKTRLPVVGTTTPGMSGTTASSRATVPIVSTASASSITTAPATSTVTSTSSSSTQSASAVSSSSSEFSTPVQTTHSSSQAASVSVTTSENAHSENAEALLGSMTVEEKVGQLFIVSISGNTLTKDDYAFLADTHMGNVVLFASNIQNSSQLAELNSVIRETISDNTGIPPFISIDQEGGKVMRIFDACTAPPMMAVGSTGDPSLARQLGVLMGEQLYTLGINLDFAPCSDVNSNPENPVIGDRSFGENAENVAVMVSAFTEGLQSGGVLACIKHFPGHGDTSVDSHSSLPSVTTERSQLDSLELVPFRAGIASGAAMTMVGHILYPALGADKVPASLSSSVIQGILRTELGFDGLITTDSLSMGAITNTWGEGEACVMAFEAGVDLLLINDSESALRSCYQAVLDAVKSGRISEERLNNSVLHILNTKYAFGLFSAPHPSANLPDTQAYDTLLREIAQKSLTLIEGEATDFIPSSTLVLCTEPRKSALVSKTQSLGSYMTRHYGTLSTEIVKSPDPEQIKALVNTYNQYSTYILAVSGTGNADLAAKLIESGKTVIVAVMDSPYTAAAYTNLGAAAVYCAYDNSDYTIRAVADAFTSVMQ